MIAETSELILIKWITYSQSFGKQSDNRNYVIFLFLGKIILMWDGREL